ncbi:MAG: 4-(cytidine 5'-diphospho)-2-C-methyl-D-erythritol kinase [Gemmatimonadota bacterium]
MVGGRAATREVWHAPAKINLWLEITGRRPDGYHTVDTCYQAIDLADTVILEPSETPGVSCTVEGPFAEGAPEGPDNLAVQAALVLAERTGHEPRLRIRLIKEIPPGAGLAGGSSDAAAVLVALAHRFAVPEPDDTLVELAAELGADVPFFLKGGTQHASGIGDRLHPIAPPAERWGILVYPGVAVSTWWAYEAYDREREESSPKTAGSIGSAGVGLGWSLASEQKGINVLAPLVCDSFPEVLRAVEVLRDGPAPCVVMTGSGSGVYSLYATEAARDADVERIAVGIQDLPGAHLWPFAFMDHGVGPTPLRGG